MFYMFLTKIRLRSTSPFFDKCEWKKGNLFERLYVLYNIRAVLAIDSTYCVDEFSKIDMKKKRNVVPSSFLHMKLSIKSNLFSVLSNGINERF